MILLTLLKLLYLRSCYITVSIRYPLLCFYSIYTGDYTGDTKREINLCQDQSWQRTFAKFYRARRRHYSKLICKTDVSIDDAMIITNGQFDQLRSLKLPSYDLCIGVPSPGTVKLKLRERSLTALARTLLISFPHKMFSKVRCLFLCRAETQKNVRDNGRPKCDERHISSAAPQLLHLYFCFSFLLLTLLQLQQIFMYCIISIF